MSGPGLIILAAGGSRRMGRPKQLMPWKGITLLRHTCETALATSCRPVVVVLGNKAEACARELAGLEVVPVVHAGWEAGMGSSVAAGIAALEEHAPDSTGALLLLVDQPAVTSAHLELLLERWSPPEWPIAAAKYPEGGGVPAILDSSYFAELRALTGDRGARGLITREAARVALVELPGALIDLDTPELYRQHADEG